MMRSLLMIFNSQREIEMQEIYLRDTWFGSISDTWPRSNPQAAVHWKEDKTARVYCSMELLLGTRLTMPSFVQISAKTSPKFKNRALTVSRSEEFSLPKIHKRLNETPQRPERASQTRPAQNALIAKTSGEWMNVISLRTEMTELAFGERRIQIWVRSSFK